MKFIPTILAFLIPLMSTSRAEEKAPQTLKVKGLYIGMSITDARDVLNHTFKEATEKTFVIVQDEKKEMALIPSDAEPKSETKNTSDGNPVRGLKESIISRLADANRLYDTDIPTVRADSGGAVTYIRIGGPLSDKLFNTADLKAPDFAQQFIDSYGISGMKAFESALPGDKEGRATVRGWQLTTSFGYTLQITGTKAVILKASPKQTERSFD